jgi:hypothetical protein
VQRLIGDLDTTRRRDPGGCLVDRDALAVVAVDLLGVVAVADHEVAVGGGLRPVQRRLAGAGRTPRLRPHLDGAQQRLGGDARPVGALSADELALAQRHAPARARQGRGRDLAAGSGADHHAS